MKRLIILCTLGFVLALPISDAHAVKLGGGGFAGMNIPVGMEDVTMSSMYGVKARIILMPAIGIEPNFIIANYGDGEAEVYGVTMARDGGDISSFGVDAVIGGIQGDPGLSVYGILGIGSAKWSREGLEDISKMNWRLGLGLEYGFTEMISLDIRSTAQIIPNEDGTYKNLGVTAGVKFYFGEMGGM